MSSLQNTLGNDDDGGGRNNANFPVLLHNVNNIQARSDDYLIEATPHNIISPKGN